jgi:hypothetical protein
MLKQVVKGKYTHPYMDTSTQVKTMKFTSLPIEMNWFPSSTPVLVGINYFIFSFMCSIL